MLKSFLDFFKTHKVDGFDATKIMTVVIPVLVVVANHPPIISKVQLVVDVSQIVASDL